jgi:hypothetical protein
MTLPTAAGLRVHIGHTDDPLCLLTLETVKHHPNPSYKALSGTGHTRKAR